MFSYQRKPTIEEKVSRKQTLYLQQTMLCYVLNKIEQKLGIEQTSCFVSCNEIAKRKAKLTASAHTRWRGRN